MPYLAILAGVAVECNYHAEWPPALPRVGDRVGDIAWLDCSDYFGAAPNTGHSRELDKVRSGDRSWTSGAPSTRRLGAGGIG